MGRLRALRFGVSESGWRSDDRMGGEREKGKVDQI
jgi:hypothetical protein